MIAIHTDGDRCDTSSDCPHHHNYVEDSWQPCGWCNDPSTGHKHYAVLVKEHSKTLGRLTPGGYTTRRNLHAMVLSFARASEISADINDYPPFPGVTAKVIPF